MNPVEPQEPPSEALGLIARQSLVDTLLEKGAGLTVLTAPGGYGKTLLLDQLAERLSAADDAHPLRHWTLHSSTTLRQALQSLCTLFDHPEATPLTTPAAGIDAALTAIARRRGPAGTLLVDLDGAAPSKPVQTLVQQVLLAFAPRGRLLVACRNAWGLPVDRIAKFMPVHVAKLADLAFSSDEIARAKNVSNTDAARWLTLTEGWPVMCGSRSHWCEARIDHPNPTAQPGDEIVRMFAHYMEHELLAMMAVRDATLLMQISIVDVVEPGVLQALLPGAPWSRLTSLMEAGLPVSPLQTDWDHIVIHPIFRHFLQRRLQAFDPELHRLMHRRAANHFIITGNGGDAVRHARQTGDPTFEAQVTERGGGWHISWHNGLQALDTGMQPAMPNLSESFPKAALARIYWQAQTGRIDEACNALHPLQACQSRQALHHDLLAIEAVIDIYRDAPLRDDQVQQLGQLREAATHEPLLFPSGLTLQAAMLNNAGLYDRAASAAREAMTEAEELGSHYVEFYGQLQYALALHGLGRVNECTSPYGRARALADHIFGSESGERKIIGLLIAHAQWLAGDDEQALHLVDEIEGLYRLHSWLDPYAKALEMGLAVGLQRADTSLQDRILDDFGNLAQRRTLPRLQVLVALGRAQQARLEGDTEAAERACDEALHITRQLHAPPHASTARVLAPAWLEKARIALTQGRFDAAAQALEQMRGHVAQIRDGPLEMEGLLLEAYVSLRHRRYREASQLASQCVQLAERSGLRRPFLSHAGLVLDLVEYTRAHALNMDERTLKAAEVFARPATADHDENRKRPSSSGHLLLTEREADVLHLLDEGISSKEMARRLAIAESTVKTHRKHLYEKLGAGLRSQALKHARKLGLL